MAIILLAHPIHADVVKTITPRITIRERYDDNLGLDANAPDADYVTTILPGMHFNAKGEYTDLDLDVEGGWTWYLDDSSRDTSDYRANASWDQRLTEFISFSLNDTFARSDDPITVVDGEVVDVRGGRRIQYQNNGEASVSYVFGENDRASVGYHNRYVDDRDALNDDRASHVGFASLDKWFGDRFGIGLNLSHTIGDFEIRDDFHQWNTGITTYYRWNPYRFGYMRYTFLDHDYDDPAFFFIRDDYQVHEAVLGVNLTLSPYTSLYLDAGYFIQQYESDYSDDQQGPVFNFSFSTRRERFTFSVDASGGFDEDYFSTDDFGSSTFAKAIGRVDYQFSESVSLFGSLDYRWDDYFDADVKEDRIRAACGLSYDFWRWHTVSLQYTYNQRESDQSTRDYIDNRIAFQLRWAYPYAF